MQMAMSLVSPPTSFIHTDLSVHSHVDTFILNIRLIIYLFIHSCFIKKTLPQSLFLFCWILDVGKKQPLPEAALDLLRLGSQLALRMSKGLARVHALCCERTHVHVNLSQTVPAIWSDQAKQISI